MNKFPIGIIIPLSNLLQNGTKDIEELGLSVCQVNCWDERLYTYENAERVKKLLDGKISVSSLWVGWPGPAIWNFWEGPLTLGLVPREYRYQRMNSIKKGAEFAYMMNIKNITTHLGFIPENPATTEYWEVVSAVKEVAQFCKTKGVNFNFETGQETPITLVRLIEDVGLDNLGINLDPANLLMYGKANPVDAVDIYRNYIQGIHVKDGKYPTDGRHLGEETAVGQGMVDFSKLIDKLQKYGYDGSYIIEREISGPQQKEDILLAKEYLINILNKY